MADNTKLQYIIELLTQGDTAKAREEFAKLNNVAGKTTTGVAALTSGFGAVSAALAASVIVAHQSIEAYIEQERAIAKLEAALKALGVFTPELSKEMQELADSLSKVSNFADEAILNVIAKLTAMGAKRQDVERLTRAVLDLSTLMDKDLNRAALAMGKALQGEFEAFSQLGIKVDETKTATEQFNEMLEKLEKRAGGQAREAMKGLGGEFEAFKKDVDSAKEAVGHFLLTMYSGSKRAFQSLILGKNIDNTPSMQDLAGTGPKPVLSADSNAALMKLMGISAPDASPVTTEGLSAKDDLAMLKQIQQIGEANAKAARYRADAEKDTEQAMEKQANEILDDILRKEKERNRLAEMLKVDVKEIEATLIQSFAGGLSHAIVSAFEEGGDAFKKFAVNFMRQMSEMILQALILKAITSAFGLSGGGQVAMRRGGMIAAAGGVDGVMDVSSPTVFPKFNVLAGEAGREVMTVLARPRMVNFNGLAAQVGFAGSRRLAITSADGLAARAGGGGGGAGGNVVIEVRVSPGSEARIVKMAAENVTVLMQQDSTLSRATKNLTK